jgi:hypothetical protein
MVSKVSSDKRKGEQRDRDRTQTGLAWLESLLSGESRTQFSNFVKFRDSRSNLQESAR